MNHSVKIIPAFFLIGVTILFSACIKEYDYVKQHPGAEVKGCRIKMMTNGYDTFYVHYNSAGDPTELVQVPLHVGSGWQGDFHFRYDKYHRLTDYFWGEPAYSDYRLIWHRYTYHGTSIVTDSLFAYITNGGGPNPPPETFDALTIDSLDAAGRIVKVTVPGTTYTPPYVANYPYNAKGNLADPSAIYDNELNIYHTSRVWMFIENDFSVNNRLNYFGIQVQITSYNAAGLPLIFEALPNSYAGELFGGAIIYQKLQVVYDCDPVNAGL